MKEISKELPPLGKPVLCWVEELKCWEIDELRNDGDTDAPHFQFIGRYIHNYTHWTELPDSPE